MTTDVSYKTTCAIDGSFHPIDLTDNQHISHLIRIMTAIQPKILVHTVNPTSNTFKSIDTASKSLAITHIYLPTQDIPHTLWMTELPLDTLSKWHDFTVNIMVNTDKKPHALARLLTSVTNAHYLGDQVDLTVLLDYSSDQITQTFANNFVWNKGEKNIRHRISQATKASVFVESWYPSSHDEYAIILNNDAELSEYFYVWVKYAILRYRYTERDNSLFGISLYTPRLLETDPSGRHFFSANYQLKKANRTGQVGQPYRMQWPGYSGAVYFPEHWREFHDYITARHADLNGFEMQDVVVPGLRSNEWTKSWRRFMEELIYLRGYVMLFPNFPSSLSTVHIELRKKAMREQFQDAVSLYNVPLMQQDLISSGLVLPDLRTLPIFDIWGQLSDIEELQERGLELHEETSSCLPSIDKEDLFDPTDLLCPFSRIKSVTLANENDSLPELSPIDVTIYT
ncbi:uncharacterized protein B0P05DRAFT_477135 [Gilbertella persicaria]|uniref:uncharacterized protein n=1 Tax=Gilbertella persicaria TaxID=101096 RepID=UPI002220FAC6|nr:uncharacterized protein B0P05DRAFT_477135 [Gilbertella persicaria]KAI8062830.1 hypothetical protein B0P05DRAFT_477135 [Gilbertella persicaria]